MSEVREQRGRTREEWSASTLGPGPSAWQRPRQLPTAGVDALLGAAYAVAGTVVSLHAGPGAGGGVWRSALVGVVAALVSAGALAVRRRLPLAALAVTGPLMLVTFTRPGDFSSIAVALALHAVAVRAAPARAWGGLGVVSAALVVVELAASPSWGTLWTVGQAVTVLVLGVLVGVLAVARRRATAALVEHLVRERDQQTALAVAAERASIVREMHDVVSHSLTVMVTLAHGAAETVALDAERATSAMRQVARTGSSALGDLRRVLGVLQAPAGSEDGEGLAPPPGACALPELVDRFRHAGLPLSFSSTGTPPSGEGLQLTVYRVVQEALTNALKHAAGAGVVRAVVDYASDEVKITVHDDAPWTPREQEETTSALDDGRAGPGPGRGRGLIGMHERVVLYGGSVRAGADPSGGWTVCAVLPVVEASP